MAAPRKRPTPSAPVLTLRELNRATLARQMLLARDPGAATGAIRRLVGLQAQLPGAPYVGLWSRLASFSRSDLARLLDEHAVVRAPFLRATLHESLAEDFVRFRSVMQPVLSRALEGLPAERTAGFDLAALVAEARERLAGGPLTMEELRAALAERFPDLDVRAMGYAVRTHLPLVQVPGKGSWGFPTEPAFALADEWLGRAPDPAQDPRELVLRYLAAFGPATYRDAQTWSGLTGLREVFEALRAELVVLASDDGRELFDVKDAPRPPGDTPAPPRFLPEFDDLMLGHFDRTRVIADAFKPKVFLSALRVRATLLVDGFVRGGWKIERTKKAATLVIEIFAPVKKAERAAIVEEGERLVRFAGEEVASHAVRIEEE